MSTGVEAPRDVAADLMRAREAGEEAYAKFKKERLESEEPD